MKIVSLVSQKGGVGKSTTAINLAVQAAAVGLGAVIIDIDPQGSAVAWRQLRARRAEGNGAPWVRSSLVLELDERLAEAEAAGVDIVFIDTAGRSDSDQIAAARVADLVLVPIGASVMDHRTLQSTKTVIALGGGPTYRVLLTKIPTIVARQESAVAALKRADMPICPVALFERIACKDAYAFGQGVTEFEPHGKAAEEIRLLLDYVAETLAIRPRASVA